MQNVEQVSEMYHKQYQADSIAIKSVLAAEAIALELFNAFAPKRSLDVGSGAGALVRALREKHGVDAFGVDGSKYAAELSGERIATWDLREVYSFEKPFDLVTCFDTAEHIEEEYAKVLVETLARNTRHNCHCVFGPAPEGQDGLGHVNLQHPTYWVNLMAQRGFELRASHSETLRRAIRQHDAHSHLWWIAKNLMVFHKVGA